MLDRAHLNRDLQRAGNELRLPRPLDDRLRLALHRPSRRQRLAMRRTMRQPGYAKNHDRRASPQLQQDSHPYFAFARFVVARAAFSCGVGAVSKTIIKVTINPEINRPNIASIALFISHRHHSCGRLHP
ncbi:hypothetical protein [Burkholderia ubonensis]|uniref:hypothetical protein n=1 Tax=Burkholderia ubonensis TaxID=101571 RepID=UPI0012FC83B3|nr:hypothetical protein [Burkholderia ubonensis]